jgi:hypothetical protein
MDAVQRPVEPLAFTAEFKVTHVQVLADGTSITRETKEIQARNGKGDFLHMQTMQQEMGAQLQDFQSTFITFVEDGSSLQWGSQNKVATHQMMPPKDQQQGCWADPQGNMRMSFGQHAARHQEQPSGLPMQFKMPERTNEELGTDMIEGVSARGLRTTTTIPAGALGNDKPLVTTEESWMAKDLGMIVLRSIRNDPRNGKQTREVVNLKLGEPDSALFEPPADYTVKVVEFHQVPCDSN